MDALDFLGCELVEVAAFGEVLADQTVGVFVEAMFPGMVGMSEVGFSFELFC